MRTRILLSALFLFAFTLISTAQKKLPIFNPSFEENKPTNQNYPGYAPAPWGTCAVAFFGPNTTCSQSQTADMNPSKSGILPDHQSFMMGAAANGSLNGNCHGGEAVYQQLCKPMQQGVQYTFTIRVACGAFFSSPPAPSPNDSAYFGVFGANGPPIANQYGNPEVLYTAKVTSTSFSTYVVTFTPMNGTYDYLIIGGYAEGLVSSVAFTGPYLEFDNITNVDTVCGMSISSKDTTICSGGCASIIVNSQDATQPITYSWNGGPFVAGDSTRTGSNAICGLTSLTSYTVVAIDANNDTAQTVINVGVQKPTVTTSFQDTTICLTESVMLNATGALTYTWAPSTGLNNPNIFNPISAPTSAGIYNYTVTGADGLGCTDTDIVKVTVLNPIPKADAGPDVIICPEQGEFDVTLTATGGNLFLWSTGQTTQTIIVSPLVTTTYSIVVSNTCGSGSDSDEVIINVQCELVIPNVITPNGDPDNQYFAIEHMDLYPNSKLEIYDRWGLKMFESDNYINDWDGGNYRTGKPVTNGVYYYILYLSDKKNTQYTGFIQVLKED